MTHLNEKPVDLAARATQFSSREVENVLDLFGEWGSVLIAVERADRPLLPVSVESEQPSAFEASVCRPSTNRVVTAAMYIITLLNQVKEGEIVLPAIQRDFVWTTRRVAELLDSIMRGYPVGIALL